MIPNGIPPIVNPVAEAGWGNVFRNLLTLMRFGGGVLSQEPAVFNKTIETISHAQEAVTAVLPLAQRFMEAPVKVTLDAIHDNPGLVTAGWGTLLAAQALSQENFSERLAKSSQPLVETGTRLNRAGEAVQQSQGGLSLVFRKGLGLPLGKQNQRVEDAVALLVEKDKILARYAEEFAELGQRIQADPMAGAQAEARFQHYLESVERTSKAFQRKMEDIVDSSRILVKAHLDEEALLRTEVGGPVVLAAAEDADLGARKAALVELCTLASNRLAGELEAAQADNVAGVVVWGAYLAGRSLALAAPVALAAACTAGISAVASSTIGALRP